MNGTSVAFTCSANYDPSGQPRPFVQSSGFSLLIYQTRSGTYWVQANWQGPVEGKSSVNKLAGFFLSQSTTVQEDGVASSTDVAEPVTDSTEVYKTTKESVFVEQGQQLRAAEPDQCVLKVKTRRQIEILSSSHTHCGVCMERTLMICIGDNKIQIWRTHHSIESMLPLRPEWTNSGEITTMERLQ